MLPELNESMYPLIYSSDKPAFEKDFFFEDLSENLQKSPSNVSNVADKDKSNDVIKNTDFDKLQVITS